MFSHKHLWFPADQTRFLQYLPLQNKLLGKGAYGHVCAVTNSENGERLAVKKVKNAFDDVIDAKRVLREIRRLPLSPFSPSSPLLLFEFFAAPLPPWIPTRLSTRQLSKTSLPSLPSSGLLCSFDHENVLSIKDLQMPKDANGKHEDVYIITEVNSVARRRWCDAQS